MEALVGRDSLEGSVMREEREPPRWAGELRELCRSWVHSPLTLPASLGPLGALVGPREARCCGSLQG